MEIAAIGEFLPTRHARLAKKIWSLVLPPATLFELRKAVSPGSEQFRIPDELWARIIYDFALAHRLRTINRDASASVAGPAVSGMGCLLCARDREL